MISPTFPAAQPYFANGIFALYHAFQVIYARNVSSDTKSNVLQKAKKTPTFSNSSSISLNILWSSEWPLNFSPGRNLYTFLSVTAPQASCFCQHLNSTSQWLVFPIFTITLFAVCSLTSASFFLISLGFSSPVSSIDFECSCWNHQVKIKRLPSHRLASAEERRYQNCKQHVSVWNLLGEDKAQLLGVE